MEKSEADRLIDVLRKDRKEQGNSKEKSLEILYKSGIVTKTGKLRKEYQTPISKKDIKLMKGVLKQINECTNKSVYYVGI